MEPSTSTTFLENGRKNENNVPEADLEIEPMTSKNGASLPKMKEKSKRLFLYWPFDYYAVSFLARFLPPYTRTAVLIFCGMELLWNMIVMILNQEFYEYSTKIFPVAYSMFIYTESRDKSDTFGWTKNNLHELTMYQHKLVIMWFVSTLLVLYCSVCIILQFFTFESIKGKKQTMCMRKPKIGYIMGPILLVLMIISFLLLICEYYTFGSYYDLFQNLFMSSLQEEKFLGEIEHNLDCVLDEDEENTGAWSCITAIQKAMFSKKLVDWLIIIYIVWHALMILLAVFFNKKIRIFKKKEENAKNVEENHGTNEPLLI